MTFVSVWQRNACDVYRLGWDWVKKITRERELIGSSHCMVQGFNLHFQTISLPRIFAFLTAHPTSRRQHSSAQQYHAQRYTPTQQYSKNRQAHSLPRYRTVLGERHSHQPASSKRAGKVTNAKSTESAYVTRLSRRLYRGFLPSRA